MTALDRIEQLTESARAEALTKYRHMLMAIDDDASPQELQSLMTTLGKSVEQAREDQAILKAHAELTALEGERSKRERAATRAAKLRDDYEAETRRIGLEREAGYIPLSTATHEALDKLEESVTATNARHALERDHHELFGLAAQEPEPVAPTVHNMYIDHTQTTNRTPSKPVPHYINGRLAGGAAG